MAELVRVHGLVVDSDVPLGQGVPVRGTDADLEVRLAPDAPVPAGPPDGVLLAHQTRPDGAGFYTVARDGHRVVLRCHGVCEIRLDTTATRATVHRDPSARRGMETVILGGMGLALVLQLRGHLVLHASAVEVGGRVLALVGRSGMGKSTLATLLCAEGGTIVTDDVLRVDVPDDGPVLAHRGSSSVRLRTAASGLADAVGSSRMTADDRRALDLAAPESDALPLAAMLVPYPDRATKTVTLDVASRPDALVLLSAFPRLPGWVDPVSRGQQFTQLGRLTRRVPLAVATLPWGPPFAGDLAATLLEQVHEQGLSRSSAR